MNQDDVRGEELEDCSKCNNTGVVKVPNGPDDFDEEWCDCRYGKAAQELSDELDHDRDY
jgi:hypothetical protein